MTAPTLTRKDTKAISYTMALPSGMVLTFNLWGDQPQEDIDFIERIIQLGIEELKGKK